MSSKESKREKLETVNRHIFLFFFWKRRKSGAIAFFLGLGLKNKVLGKIPKRIGPWEGTGSNSRWRAGYMAKVRLMGTPAGSFLIAPAFQRPRRKRH